MVEVCKDEVDIHVCLSILHSLRDGPVIAYVILLHNFAPFPLFHKLFKKMSLYQATEVVPIFKMI